MKNYWRNAAVALAALAVSTAGWAARSDSGATGRFGLGVNLGRADVRKELDSMSAVDGFLGLDTKSTSGASTTGVTIGGYYLKRLIAANPVSFHFLGGISYDSDSVSSTVAGVTFTTKETSFNLFGGVGSEYFLPGTTQLSIEANVGLNIAFINDEVPNFVAGGTTSTSSTGISLKDLTGGVIMLRYYFAN